MKIKTNLLIIFGLLVAVLPYSGFPQGFRNFLFTFLGLMIFVYAYSIARKNVSSSSKHKGGEDGDGEELLGKNRQEVFKSELETQNDQEQDPTKQKIS